MYLEIDIGKNNNNKKNNLPEAQTLNMDQNTQSYVNMHIDSLTSSSKKTSPQKE